ncbi:hypothetical protein POTOM_028319 [Populus tomentosa]|uniref:Uncharacterized protein n=1 Tax=Populus tomentosa TaxID=118781 RepID=A0A8X7ZPZ1_POPTO|nr:hypothetical protein POTOM_028319 [Populus tomentosa]
MVNLMTSDSSHSGMNDGRLYRYSQEKLEEGSCWYFSRKEIEDNSPSRQDGIDLKKEAYLRKSYCTFLQDFGMRLKCAIFLAAKFLKVKLPSDANSEAERSIVGGASHRATSKASSNNEEHMAPNNHSQTGDVIELVAESEKNKHDRRQSWSKPLDREEYENSHHGKNIDARDEKCHGMRGQLSQKSDLNNIKDGELPAPDDMDQGFPSPKLINRKHKASSPRDRKFKGKHRNDNVPGSHHYNHHDYADDRNRMNRLEYLGSLSMYRNDDDDNLVIIMVLDCKLGGIHFHIQR